MNWGGVEICCPVCREDLSESGRALECRECRRSFPVVGGIPDLRVFADPYIGMEDDRKKAAGLTERLEQETFESLIDYYYNSTSVVPAHHARLYKRSLLTGLARAEASLESWERAARAPAAGRILDIGCGTGPLLVAAAKRGYAVAGVDIALRWLVVARKRLSEAGLSAPLICACAEALPFRAERFDRVAIDSVIEMVADQSRSMQESHRVLAPGGRLFLGTPNRFSLGPDPHLGVPAGGFWPQAWLAAMARRQGAIPPKRNLLWAQSLARLIRSAGFDGMRLELPRIPGEQMTGLSSSMRAAVRIYGAVQQLTPTRPFLFLLGPLLHATACKPPLAEPVR